MSWFLFALVATLGWGLADLFYKKGSDEGDRYSHLRIACWVGLIMGLAAFALLPFSESALSPEAILRDALRYAPASLSYILSMVIGYAGLRYLELSIISPVQNASGALSAICIAGWFLFRGKAAALREEFSLLDLIGTLFIVAGVILLAVTEQRIAKKEAGPGTERKYTAGALALLFPLLYCLFDTIGTAADGILLDGETGLGLGEIDVLILYGFTFFLAGVGCFIFLWCKEKKPYNLFARSEWPKGAAALAEEFGQIFYVYAMAKNPVLAAPMIASYCIVSVILSRIFLKERLGTAQTLCVATVVAGILLLGISEGLAEL